MRHPPRRRKLHNGRLVQRQHRSILPHLLENLRRHGRNIQRSLTPRLRHVTSSSRPKGILLVRHGNRKMDTYVRALLRWHLSPFIHRHLLPFLLYKDGMDGYC